MRNPNPLSKNHDKITKFAVDGYQKCFVARYLHILSRAKSHFKKYYIFPTFLCSNLYKNKSEPESEQKKEEIIENNNNGAYEYENNDTEQFFTKDRQTFSP